MTMKLKPLLRSVYVSRRPACWFRRREESGRKRVERTIVLFVAFEVERDNLGMLLNDCSGDFGLFL